MGRADGFDWARQVGARTYDLPTAAELVGMQNVAEQVARDTRAITASQSFSHILRQMQSPLSDVIDNINKHNSAYLATTFDTSKFAEQITRGIAMPDSPVRAIIEQINEQTRGITLGSAGAGAGKQLAEQVMRIQAEITRPDVDWFRREVIDPAIDESLDDLDVAADEFVQSVEDYVAASSPELDVAVEDLLAADTALEHKVKMTTGWQTLVDKLPSVAETTLVRVVVIYVVSIGVVFLPDNVKADIGTYAGLVALLLSTTDALRKKPGGGEQP